MKTGMMEYLTKSEARGNRQCKTDGLSEKSPTTKITVDDETYEDLKNRQNARK